MKWGDELGCLLLSRWRASYVELAKLAYANELKYQPSLLRKHHKPSRARQLATDQAITSNEFVFSALYVAVGEPDAGHLFHSVLLEVNFRYKIYGSCTAKLDLQRGHQRLARRTNSITANRAAVDRGGPAAARRNGAFGVWGTLYPAASQLLAPPAPLRSARTPRPRLADVRHSGRQQLRRLRRNPQAGRTRGGPDAAALCPSRGGLRWACVRWAAILILLDVLVFSFLFFLFFKKRTRKF